MYIYDNYIFTGKVLDDKQDLKFNFENVNK